MKKVYIVYYLLSNEVLHESRVYSSMKKVKEYLEYKTNIGYDKDDFVIIERYVF